MTASGLLRALVASAILCGVAACAQMPVGSGALAPVAPATQPDLTAAFIREQRAEASRQEEAGKLAEARLHWRYIAALVPDDPQAQAEIARLDSTIRTRVAALLAQGDAAAARNRIGDAQIAFLKVLALDGANQRARMRLRELDTRASFIAQDRKDRRAREAARTAGIEGPQDE